VSVVVLRRGSDLARATWLDRDQGSKTTIAL
jgi:hypothetical protein